MKNLFLLYACAEKFRAAKIGAINVSLLPKASMAEFHAAKREDAMKILEFLRKQTERELEILKFLSARHFGSHKQTAERRSEILKFTAAERLKSRAASQKQAAEFLNFTPMPCNRFGILIKNAILRRSYERGRAMGFLKFTHALARLANAVQNFISQHRFRILKFVPGCVHYTYIAQNFASQCEFKILKFIHEPPHALRDALIRALLCTSLRADIAEAGRAARLTSQHAHDAIEKRRAVKFNHAGGYLNSVRSARRRIVRLCSAAVRHSYEVGRAENFSKFDLTGALLNFISLLLRKFKLALLKFMREVPRDRSEILNFTPELSNRFEILKFTLAPRKFKPASIPLLNFISNFTPHARASKFENGVKFKGAAKFERSVR